MATSEGIGAVANFANCATALLATTINAIPNVTICARRRARKSDDIGQLEEGDDVAATLALACLDPAGHGSFTTNFRSLRAKVVAF
ncbi:MAG: hypothetical protein ABJB74_11085, partial [Gemmatimonas sp.]